MGNDQLNNYICSKKCSKHKNLIYIKIHVDIVEDMQSKM